MTNLNTKTSILVAEDEAPIRTIWDRFLRRWGLEADLAENGQQALEMARRKPYQLLITDLTMPMMTGQELVHTMKSEQPEVEIIVTTGQGTIEIAVEMMKAGAYEFITKPISFNRAEFVIKKCLEKIYSQQENRRLVAKARDLEELNLMKEKFIAITSHELRTPVSIISNVVEILSQEMAGREAENMVKILGRSAQHLSEIVGQMHELSQLGQMRLALNPSRFPLRPLCEEILHELSIIIQERGLQVNLDMDPELLFTADRMKFKKVVWELVENAVKFTPNGGNIRIGGRQQDNQMIFEVADSGVGIPPEEKEKIFQMFYEVTDTMYHHSSKNSFMGGGMGVGLTVVQEIVAAHHGKVEVLGQPGSGSTFVVTLPMANPQGA
ncbi:MAG: response regulator [Deltaproteobacteria bacterium]|nr:response regulator [Deltaproteobacteria bacterium]